MFDERILKAKFVSFFLKRKRNINSFKFKIHSFEHDYIHCLSKLTMIKNITMIETRSAYFGGGNMHKDYKVKSCLCYIDKLYCCFLMREHEKARCK